RLAHDLHIMLFTQGAHVAFHHLRIADLRRAGKGRDDARTVDPLILGHTLVVQPLAKGHHVTGIAVHYAKADHVRTVLSLAASMPVGRQWTVNHATCGRRIVVAALWRAALVRLAVALLLLVIVPLFQISLCLSCG